VRRRGGRAAVAPRDSYPRFRPGRRWDSIARMHGVWHDSVGGCHSSYTPSDMFLSHPSLRIVDIRLKNAYKVNHLYRAARVSMYARMFYTRRGLLR
jgi:hypothetical protein